MATATSRLHFTITGEFITQQARTWWIENEHERAQRFLASAFPTMPETDRMDVILGKQKVTGENDCCELEPDSATEHLGQPLLTLAALLTRTKAALKQTKEDARCYQQFEAGDVTMVPSPFGGMLVPNMLVRWARKEGHTKTPCCTMGWAEFKTRFPDMVEVSREKAAAVKETLDAMHEAVTIADETERRLARRGNGFPFVSLPIPPHLAHLAPALQAAQNAILNPMKELPLVDKGMNGKNGWLSPDGKFYPCSFMGHGTLAQLLSPQGEPGLEKAWVRISDCKDPGLMFPRSTCAGSDFLHIPDRGVTQTQLNAMQRWCDVHQRELPPNLDVR